ncbi:DUF7878 domain-containing protein [Peribacillus loiseleuriae]
MLEVLVNDKCFLAPFLALSEFRVTLTKRHKRKNFYYYKIENDESVGAILVIINMEKITGLYFFCGNNMNEESLSLIHITNPVDLFSNELDKEIINSFGIRIANFKPHLNDCKDLVIHTPFSTFYQ